MKILGMIRVNINFLKAYPYFMVNRAGELY